MSRAALLMLVLAAAVHAQTHPTSYLGGRFLAKNSVTIAVFAEGWTQDDIASGKFMAAAKQAASGIFSIKPYDQYSNWIRIIGIGTPSTSHGIRRTGENVMRMIDGKDKVDRSDKFQTKETYFGVFINSAESAPNLQGRTAIRDDMSSARIPSGGISKLEDLIDENPCQYAMLLTPDDDLPPTGVSLKNERLPPGQGKLPCPVVIVNAGYALGALAAHELGHSMFNLGDEYRNGGGCAGIKELPYPNVSFFNDQRCPWFHLFDCIGRPIPGGQCANSFVPSSTCLMGPLAGEGKAQAGFCEVCLEAMTHRVGELASLIEYTEPGGPVVTGVPSGSWIFKVNTRGSETSDYTGCWFIDGKSMGEGTKTASRNGPRFELAFSVKTGIIDSGLHTIRFTVVNNLAPTKLDEKCKKHLGKTPNVKTWRMVAAPFKLNIPILESGESWD